jgi:hypothetical protein
MGDHRANIVIEFDFHGKKYKYDAWLNYFPNDAGNDIRVMEFFQESYEDGMRRYEEQMAEIHRKANKEQIEREEKQLYENLKKKFAPHE